MFLFFFQIPFYSSIVRQIAHQYPSVRSVFTEIFSLFLDEAQKFGLSEDPNHSVRLIKT